eukprot:61600_1
MKQNVLMQTFVTTVVVGLLVFVNADRQPILLVDDGFRFGHCSILDNFPDEGFMVEHSGATPGQTCSPPQYLPVVRRSVCLDAHETSGDAQPSFAVSAPGRGT